MKPINILFESWYKLQHSYGIVAASLIVHLYEDYHYIHGSKIKLFNFYIKDAPYYKENWYNTEKNIYPVKYTNVFKQLVAYTDSSLEKMDIIYRQSFPYNIENNDSITPKIIFYTSEFGPGLDISYFTGLFPNSSGMSGIVDINTQLIEKNLYFTTPSLWSSQGLSSLITLPLIASPEESCDKNKIISHGVDTSIYFPFGKDKYNQRLRIRDKYNIKENDILLFHLGAMTTNKGILLILQLLYVLVIHLKKTHFKLLLKGSDDLYDSKEMIKIYFNMFKSQQIISEADIDLLQKNNIIFINDTLTSPVLNAYFNACDTYISPYNAEGFGMVFLESLSSGLPIIVPETGSTKEYLTDIYENVNNSSRYIYYIKSDIVINSGKMTNNIDINNLLKTIIDNEQCIQEMKQTRFVENSDLYNYIDKKHSWYVIAEEMKNYILNILNHSKL